MSCYIAKCSPGGKITHTLEELLSLAKLLLTLFCMPKHFQFYGIPKTFDIYWPPFTALSETQFTCCLFCTLIYSNWNVQYYATVTYISSRTYYDSSDFFLWHPSAWGDILGIRPRPKLVSLKWTYLSLQETHLECGNTFPTLDFNSRSQWVSKPDVVQIQIRDHILAATQVRQQGVLPCIFWLYKPG